MDKSENISINSYSCSNKNSKTIHENNSEIESSPPEFYGKFLEPKWNCSELGTEDSIYSNIITEVNNTQRGILQIENETKPSFDYANISNEIIFGFDTPMADFNFGESHISSKSLYKGSVAYNIYMFELIHEMEFSTFSKKQLIFDVKKQYSSIFHPGSNEEYPRKRDLLYIISENKAKSSLSKKRKAKKKNKI